MYYYAHLNVSNIVDSVYASDVPITDEGYIEITESQYNTPITTWRYYPDEDYFEEWYWVCDTNEIRYPDTLIMATDVIDDIAAKIENKADVNHTHSEYASSDDLVVLTDVVNTKADANHTHSEYTPLSHTHDEYATITAFNTLEDEVDGKANAMHSHTEYASSSHSHDEYANINHSHSNYADVVHRHDNYSLTTHTHTASEVGAAASVHNHDEDYSSISHSHTDYATVTSLNEVSAIATNKANATDLSSHVSNTGLHITEAERNNWNAKSDFSGSYNDLTNKPNIPSTNGLATETYVDEAVSTKANLSHSHNDIYYTESEIDTKLVSKSDSSHTHSGVYDVSGAAANALTSANAYTDTKINALIGDGASATLDTIGEISSAIEENQDAIDLLNSAIGTKANASDFTSHTENKSNPHSVTKSQVGLSNVPNLATNDQTPTYSDATTLATLTSGEKLSVAFGKIKLAITNLINHIANKSNPHNVTKSQVGLGNVDNTSDVNKPISTATQTALDGKASSTHTHSAATTSAAGLMSASDKSKLDGITASADSVLLSRSLTSGTKVGTITINGTGTDLYAPTNTDTHYVSGTIVGSSTSATSNTTSALTNGNVYLNHIENGSVKNSHKISGSGATTVTSDASGNIVVSSTNTTYVVATSSGLGLVKSGTDITVDSSGNVSVNDDSHNHVISNIDNLQSSLDAKQATVTGGASTITSSNLIANRALVSNASGKVAVSAVTSTELGYLDGVTSNVQTQLDGKAASSHNHSASNITSGTLSSDRLPTVPISKGGTGATTAAAALTNLGITATAAELNYVDGVTSNVQTQLNGKSSTSHTHSYAGSSSVGGAATSANKLNTNAGDSNTPVYFSNGVPVACTSLDLNTTGSAATATKLQTARTIGLSTGATGTATSFNGTANISIPVTDVKEAYLSWGGKALSGSVTPVDAASSNLHSANRFTFAKAAGITIEYSTNGGSTYSTYSTTDSAKINLVSGIGSSYYIGARSSSTTINDKLRITLNATNMGLYTRLRKILINITTGYATGSNVIVEKAMKGSESTYTTVGTYSISGWSGWNSVPINAAFGGGSTQTSNIANIRLTFGITGINSNQTSNALTIMDIIGIGDTYWSYSSNMAKSGHLYAYDASQNATFPASVNASTFAGSGVATVSEVETYLGI